RRRRKLDVETRGEGPNDRQSAAAAREKGQEADRFAQGAEGIQGGPLPRDAGPPSRDRATRGAIHTNNDTRGTRPAGRRRYVRGPRGGDRLRWAAAARGDLGAGLPLGRVRVGGLAEARRG